MVIAFRIAAGATTLMISIIGSVYIDSPVFRGYKFEYDWIPAALDGVILGILTLEDHILASNQRSRFSGRQLAELSPVISSAILILFLYIDARSTSFILVAILAFENGFFWTSIVRSASLHLTEPAA
jgi:hypothetical protein